MNCGPGRTSTIGVDVGGTSIRAVFLGPGHEFEASAVLRSPLTGRGDGLATQVRDLVLGSPWPIDEVAAIGVGLAGHLDRQGVMRRSAHLPGAVGAPLATALQAALGVSPVYVTNDANCAALAAGHELRLLGRHPRSLVAVNFGTGIGAGILVDGRLWMGSSGMAGEPGHMIVNPEGLICDCGQRGCWETEASGRRLTERVVAARSRRPDASLPTSGLPRAAAANAGPAAGRSEPAPERALLMGLEAGAEWAGEVLGEHAGWIALGLANLVQIIDPELVTLGGGLANLGDFLLEALELSLGEYSLALEYRTLMVELAPGGEYAGVLGAALLAAQRIAQQS